MSGPSQAGVGFRASMFGLALLALIGTSGCAGGVPQPVGSPVPDPAATAAEVIRATTPESPRQVTFNWVLNESGTRLRGRGVARVEAPERLRLDLFGPRGETYLVAALVQDSIHLPAAVRGRVELPSPSLLWAALGIVRPPTDAELTSATRSGELLVLRYDTRDAQILEFQARESDGAPVLQRLERLGNSGVLESIELSRNEDGLLGQTRYRNWPRYRELILEIEEIEDVSSFPIDIWMPAGVDR